jgi:cobalt-zinc-cadmium resistance protein CzcA
VEAHDKESLVAAMEEGLRQDVPGVNFAFSQPIELRTNELIEGVRSDVALILYGDDLATEDHRRRARGRARPRSKAPPT